MERSTVKKILILGALAVGLIVAYSLINKGKGSTPAPKADA